jgi:hypothetical protein
MVVTELAAGGRAFHRSFLGALPVYAGLLGLPCALALAAARPGPLRCAVLAVLTAVSVVAGWLVATTDDAQAGLAALWVPLVAVPLAIVVFVGQAVAGRWSSSGPPGVGVQTDIPAPGRPSPATPTSAASAGERVAALAIDAVVVGVTVAVPASALGDAGLEAVAVLAVVGTATLYLTAAVAATGQTLGHWALRVAVVDAATREPPLPLLALARGLLTAVEVLGAMTLYLAPLAVADLAVTAATGRSFSDRLARTIVVRLPQHG